MQVSDEDLMRACSQGDQSAWETLIARYERLVYAIPRRAGLDQEQATEVFQYVFARLVDSIDRIGRPERIRSWLVTVAKRETWRVKKQARVAALQPSIDHDESLHSLPDDAILPADVVERLEEQHLLRQALEQLDARCQSLLTLLYYRQDPLPYTEIAELLAMTPGGIGPTRARCLQKLRRLVEDLDF